MSWLEIWAMIQVLGFVIPAVCIIGMLLFFVIKDAIIQRNCNHEKYYENRACDAICTQCGKNLGFIGTVRKERAANNT